MTRLLLDLAGLSLGILLCICDLRERRLPTPLVAALGFEGVFFHMSGGSSRVALAGGVLAFGVLWLLREAFWRLKGIDAVGFGDVRLAGALGVWVGPYGVGPMLAVASFLAMLSWPWLGGKGKESAGFPFGVALILAALGVLLAARLGLGGIIKVAMAGR